MLAPAALDPAASPPAPSAPATIRCGVGIDTSRYGHYAAFLRDDLQPAADELAFVESAKGYEQFRQRLVAIAARHPAVTFVIRLDAAGQYADNLLHFLPQLDRASGQPAQALANAQAAVELARDGTEGVRREAAEVLQTVEGQARSAAKDRDLLNAWLNVYQPRETETYQRG